jgi:hypothetical protein
MLAVSGRSQRGVMVLVEALVHVGRELPDFADGTEHFLHQQVRMRLGNDPLHFDPLPERGLDSTPGDQVHASSQQTRRQKPAPRL